MSPHFQSSDKDAAETLAGRTRPPHRALGPVRGRRRYHGRGRHGRRDRRAPPELHERGVIAIHGHRIAIGPPYKLVMVSVVR